MEGVRSGAWRSDEGLLLPKLPASTTFSAIGMEESARCCAILIFSSAAKVIRGQALRYSTRTPNCYPIHTKLQPIAVPQGWGFPKKDCFYDRLETGLLLEPSPTRTWGNCIHYHDSLPTSSQNHDQFTVSHISFLLVRLTAIYIESSP